MTRPNRSIIAFAGGFINREYLLIGSCWCYVPNRRGALCRIVKIEWDQTKKSLKGIAKKGFWQSIKEFILVLTNIIPVIGPWLAKDGSGYGCEL